MDKFYFDDNRGYLCCECAEDIYSENLDLLEALPEASIAAPECDICAFTKKRFVSQAKKSIASILERLF